MWRSCAVAVDGCIYFMPYFARRIMKMDPNNNDAMTSVGDDLGDGWEKYSGTVVGIDGCVYGIPFECSRIVKYDPINDTTSFVGEEANRNFNGNFKCSGGALGRDGCIYALSHTGRVLKIDTANNSHRFVRNFCIFLGIKSWGNAILGIDGCIYWPPQNVKRTLKYDPHSNQISGGNSRNVQEREWDSGALSADGVIYCFPFRAKQILAIDPIGEFLSATKAKIQKHPEEFGSLFQIIKTDEDSSLSTSLTNFDHAVLKFGHNKVFEILEKCIQPMDDYCEVFNLQPLMIAASCKESRVCVINYLVRRDLSWLNSCIDILEGNEPKNKKRRNL